MPGERQAEAVEGLISALERTRDKLDDFVREHKDPGADAYACLWEAGRAIDAGHVALALSATPATAGGGERVEKFGADGALKWLAAEPAFAAPSALADPAPTDDELQSFVTALRIEIEAGDPTPENVRVLLAERGLDLVRLRR